MRCIYCNEEKPESDFSLEHIFPTALGGKSIKSPLFKTKKVCKRCNNLCGLYIDSSFVKNFFVSSQESYSRYFGFYDFESNPYIPFTYLGFVEDIKHPDYKFCETWLWADGSRVFHFHNNSSGGFDTIAGGDPRKRKSNESSVAYLLGITNNSFWVSLLLKAFHIQFKKSRKFLTNYTISTCIPYIFDIPVNQDKLIAEQLIDYHNSGDYLKSRLIVDQYFNVRFQAKIALGLGTTLFGEKFAFSEEGDRLRDILWDKEYKKLDDIKPEMLNFFSPSKLALEKAGFVGNFPGSHALYFIIIENSLFFYADLYGESKYLATVLITKNLEKYKHDFIDKYPFGWGYILLPQRDIFIGEFPIEYIIAYNTGDKSYIPKLAKIEKLHRGLDELPPFILKQDF